MFRHDGPDADLMGRREGYPHCSGFAFLQDPRCRVGALSHFDVLFPARTIRAPEKAAPLRRTPGEPAVRYVHDGKPRTLDDYVGRNMVSGLLVARGDTILVERYQYARTDRHRLASFSMAKTVTGLLAGLALRDGAIRSLDDTAETYVPALRGTAYGATTVRQLLGMTSGVRFDEAYTNTSSDIYQLADLTLGQAKGGAEQAMLRWNQRAHPAGTRFSYSSADSTVLGLVVAGAVRRTMAEYAQDQLWGPLGAEADASWNVDANGQAIGFAYFNAVLRDWARLGLMLAHDGQWNGRAVLPRDWVLAATTVAPGSPFWSPTLQPGQHVPGYGYHVWLLPTPHRTFSLRGLRGQFVLVDPASRLVLVQTAVREDQARDAELLSLWQALVAAPPAVD